MDSHFNAYKAKYEVLDSHCAIIERAQYMKSLDIFISFDDLMHNLHRPLVNTEFQVCGIKAHHQACANLINVIAHYKRWAAKKRIPCKVYAYYTSTRQGGFKNTIFNADYRKYQSSIEDSGRTEFHFVNMAMKRAIGLASDICSYVNDVFVIDSRYIEPSALPMYLKRLGVATGEWGMVVSRDTYDLQYAYRDKWILVSPRGENTAIIDRHDLWKYIEFREKIPSEKLRNSAYCHDLYTLALAVVGNKYRNIPRLQRIGWRTMFKHMDTISETESMSYEIISERLVNLLLGKGVPMKSIDNNLSTTSIDQQCSIMNSIDKAYILSQLNVIPDHMALNTINESLFKEFPINIQFLLASHNPTGAFAF